MLSRLRESIARRARPFRRGAAFFWREYGLPESRPRGHDYSPLPDTEAGAAIAERAAARNPLSGLPGIRLDPGAQRRMLMEMTGLGAEFDWPHAPTDARRYYTGQNWFPAADAFVLYALLQLMKPKRVIEVGSGYSSALMLDAREFKLRPQPALTFIDPSPERLRSLLRPGDVASATVHAAALQDVPQEIFGELEAGDFLFVDSSHVSKVGSEVHTILFEIVPALAPGVIVHFHDVFWPFEYPAKWIRSGVAWNESYLLRAFLMFNSAFEVLFWGPYAAAMVPDAAAALGKFRLKESASLWLRRAR